MYRLWFRRAHQASSNGNRSVATGASPSSSTMPSHVDEGNEMAALNCGLAAYIERVRKLESDNAALCRALQEREASSVREAKATKELYEAELRRMLKKLHRLAEERASLQLEFDKVDKQQKRLIHAVEQLETETFLRLDCEKRIKDLKEELKLKAQVHEQELVEFATHSKQTAALNASLLNASLLQEREEVRGKMEEICRQNDARVEKVRTETEAAYERQMTELKSVADEKRLECETLDAQLRKARSDIEMLNAQLREKRITEDKIAELELQLRNDRCDHNAEVESREAEMKRMQAVIDKQMKECRDLADAKIKLDSQIATYRRLMGAEETRLNETTPQCTPNSTPLQDRKRKAAVADEQSSGFKVTSAATGSIEAPSVDADGNTLDDGEVASPCGTVTQPAKVKKGWSIFRA